MSVHPLAIPGFFGKLPVKGDFVERRLPKEFVKVWDGWLQQCIAGSQAELGDDWLDTYLHSPLWRFATSSGLFGDTSYIGVVMPSVDKVGRYYPLTIALEVHSEGAPFELLDENQSWFEDAEHVLLSVLDESPPEFDVFDDNVSTLSQRLGNQPSLSSDAQTPTRYLSGDICQFSVSIHDALRGPAFALLSETLQDRLGPYSVWSTTGSRDVEASLLICGKLPKPEAFAALLDGQWQQHGWPARDLKSGAVGSEWVQPVSASRTHAGHVRTRNEDDYLCRDDLRTWIVADGVGGQPSGDLASAMVVQVINQVPAVGTLADKVDTVCKGFKLIQETLWLVGGRFQDAADAASTAVVLIATEDKVACLWVGDSRIYRLRNGTLKQLTTDHSESLGGTNRHVITRAIGAPDDLHTEVICESVEPKDRFLLCTDGLYQSFSNDQLIDILSLSSADQACQALEEGALKGPASDNLTAIVVDLQPPLGLDSR